MRSGLLMGVVAACGGRQKQTAKVCAAVHEQVVVRSACSCMPDPVAGKMQTAKVCAAVHEQVVVRSACSCMPDPVAGKMLIHSKQQWCCQRLLS